MRRRSERELEQYRIRRADAPLPLDARARVDELRAPLWEGLRLWMRARRVRPTRSTRRRVRQSPQPRARNLPLQASDARPVPTSRVQENSWRSACVLKPAPRVRVRSADDGAENF